MSFTLSNRSLNNLQGVNPDLVKVVKRAIEITTTDFVVTEGLRTKERQAILVKEGKSKTMNSRHILGQAVDLAPIVDGKVSWEHKHFLPLAEAMLQAAKELGVKLTWGGHWKTFVDMPHFQIELQ